MSTFCSDQITINVHIMTSFHSDQLRDTKRLKSKSRGQGLQKDFESCLTQFLLFLHHLLTMKRGAIVTVQEQIISKWSVKAISHFTTFVKHKLF